MNRLIVVPDENVFVSGATIAVGPSAQVLRAWREKKIEVATSEVILENMEIVLRYDHVRKFTKMSDERITEYIDSIREFAIIVAGNTPLIISPDPKDNKIFACAIEAKADYIISGDKKHVLAIESYKGVKTISPKNFVTDILSTKM